MKSEYEVILVRPGGYDIVCYETSSKEEAENLAELLNHNLSDKAIELGYKHEVRKKVEKQLNIEEVM